MAARASVMRGPDFQDRDAPSRIQTARARSVDAYGRRKADDEPEPEELELLLLRDELLEDEPPDDEELDEPDELDELEELDEVLEDELDDDELDVDELEDVLDDGEEDELDEDDPSGPVGEPSSHPVSRPAPASATPPDNSLRNWRRSSRRVSASWLGVFSELPILRDLLRRPLIAIRVPLT